MVTDEIQRQKNRAQTLKNLGCATISRSEADELFRKASELIQKFSKEWKLKRAVVFGPYAQGAEEIFDIMLGIEADIEPDRKQQDAIARCFKDLPRVVAMSLTYPPIVPSPKGLMLITEVEGFYDQPMITLWERRKPTLRRKST